MAVLFFSILLLGGQDDFRLMTCPSRGVRPDLLEATLSNSASDVADISDIGEFGSTMYDISQRAELPENEEITAADRLIVESPTSTGLIIVRALAPEPGLMPAVRAVLANARCQRQ